MAASRCVAGTLDATLVLFLGLIAGTLAGCGSTGKTTLTPNGPPPITASIPGNWEFTGTITTNTSQWPLPSGETVPIGAYLTSTGSAVTGSASVQMAFPLVCMANCCGGPFAEFSNALTGTLNADGMLTLTSTVPNGGPVFTMTGTMSNATFTGGTFNLTGGCPASGTITGVELPSLDGTYAGTVTSKDTGQSYSLSTTLEQSTTVNARGFLDVSGTATFAGYPCLTSVTPALPLEQNSGFLGNQFSATMNGAGGATLSISGTLSQDGKTIAATYTASGGACKLDYGTGTLTLK